MHTLQQSSEVVAAAAVADSDAPEVGLSSSSLLLLLLLLSTRAVGTPYERVDRMVDCTQKLQATISAAVES